ncbi:MAG: hypothetical protein PHU25_06345 [Deltaproteobacteria bacterium]|nr:hypothetical protein [Deltaproteobacteria bacterium]
MGTNRLFWPQTLLDEWMVEEKISIDAGTLTVVGEKARYRVKQAVHFLADVGDGSDPHKLLGRVKELETLTALGAEQYMDSVILGDSAYKVAPGFTGEPLVDVSSKERLEGAFDISRAIAKETGGKDDSNDQELLARFLLENL